eukprot:5899526-Alexandrium_andersonii.AAC.1
MSASLVGSEMCIRDRLHTKQRPWGEAFGGPWPCEARNRKSGSAGRGPVSYTHLTLPTICSV